MRLPMPFSPKTALAAGLIAVGPSRNGWPYAAESVVLRWQGGSLIYVLRATNLSYLSCALS